MPAIAPPEYLIQTRHQMTGLNAYFANSNAKTDIADLCVRSLEGSDSILQTAGTLGDNKIDGDTCRCW